MIYSRDFSSLPQSPVKGPFPNEKYSKSKIIQNSQNFHFDSQMATLWIKSFPKWYQKYHSQNPWINPCILTDIKTP